MPITEYYPSAARRNDFRPRLCTMAWRYCTTPHTAIVRLLQAGMDCIQSLGRSLKAEPVLPPAESDLDPYPSADIHHEQFGRALSCS